MTQTIIEPVIQVAISKTDVQSSVLKTTAIEFQPSTHSSSLVTANLPASVNDIKLPSLEQVNKQTNVRSTPSPPIATQFTDSDSLNRNLTSSTALASQHPPSPPYNKINKMKDRSTNVAATQKSTQSERQSIAKVNSSETNAIEESTNVCTETIIDPVLEQLEKLNLTRDKTQIDTNTQSVKNNVEHEDFSNINHASDVDNILNPETPNIEKELVNDIHVPLQTLQNEHKQQRQHSSILKNAPSLDETDRSASNTIDSHNSNNNNNINNSELLTISQNEPGILCATNETTPIINDNNSVQAIKPSQNNKLTNKSIINNNIIGSSNNTDTSTRAAAPIVTMTNNIESKHECNTENNLVNNNNNIDKDLDNNDFNSLKQIPSSKSQCVPSVLPKLNSNNIEQGNDVSAAATENSSNTLKRAASKSQSLLQYEVGQWSPSNSDGRKFYKRDQLIFLREMPASITQPACINDLGAIAKVNNLLPKFIANQFNKPTMPSQRNSAYNKRPSQTSQQQQQMQAGGGGGKGSKSGGMIHVSLSLREEIKLNETENAWKPSFYQKDNRDDKTGESLYKRVRGVLNKLTPEKFDTLLEQMTNFDIDTVEKLNGVIVLVFEKAIDEPNFSVAYARLCHELSHKWLAEDRNSRKADNESKKDAAERSATNNTQQALFKKSLITKCQHEFQLHVDADSTMAVKLAPFQQRINECTDIELRAEYVANLEEEERKLRRRSVGTVRFIGELFKIDMLTANIMIWCVTTMLTKQTEDKLECLCKLLTTVGQKMESKVDMEKYKDLTEYFRQMQLIVDKKISGLKVSSRVRFMLQDVIELRKHKWIPRRIDANPKTMGQIQKEAEAEQNNIQLLNYNLPSGRKDDNRSGGSNNNRGDNRMGGSSTGSGGYNQNKSNRGSGGGSGGGMHNDDGWSSVSNKSRGSFLFYPSKLQANTVSYFSTFTSFLFFYIYC